MAALGLVLHASSLEITFHAMWVMEDSQGARRKPSSWGVMPLDRIPKAPSAGLAGLLFLNFLGFRHYFGKPSVQNNISVHGQAQSSRKEKKWCRGSQGGAAGAGRPRQGIALKSRARFAVEVGNFPPPCRLLARGARSVFPECLFSSGGFGGCCFPFPMKHGSAHRILILFV